jgi:hypothetical protein
MTAPGRSYLRSVLGAITWKTCVISLSLGLVVNLVRWLQNARHAPANFLYSGLLISSLGALLVMGATLAADEAVRRGARYWLAYWVALGTAGILTATGQYYVRGLLHLYTAVSQPGVRNPVQRTQMIFVFFDVVMFGGLAMFTYVNRSLARTTLEEVRRAELQRIEAERRLTESNLAAARALVDPDSLFADLGKIRSLYLEAVPHAEAELDALIRRLNDAVRPAAPA